MKYFDIEAYLEGTLSGKMLEEFESELRTNPEFLEEVNAQKQLIEDLKDIDLSKKVTNALKRSNEASSHKQSSGFVRNAIFIILAILVGSFYVYQYLIPDAPPLKSPTDQEFITPPSDIDTSKSQPAIKEKADQQQQENRQKLYAKNEELNPLRKKVKPNLRSMGDTSNVKNTIFNIFGIESYLPVGTKLKRKFEKIDAAIRSNDNSKAYARLQQLERKEPSNDTIAFLKSYCLLTMDEGEEAINMLDDLETDLPQWKDQIAWYRVQGFLLIDDKESARLILNNIMDNQEHTFNAKAKDLYKLVY